MEQREEKKVSTSARFISLRGEYFCGPEVGQRMNQIRAHIEQVRAHWDALGPWFEEQYETLAQEDRHTYAALLNYTRKVVEGGGVDWYDQLPEAAQKALLQDGRFDYLVAYTGEEEYNTIFGKLNEIFRAEDLEGKPALFNVAALLLEFINVDLFNYTQGDNFFPGYQGVVYRALWLTPDHIGRLADPVLQKAPDMAVPLSLQSATYDRQAALAFMRQSLLDNGWPETTRPLLLKIYVQGLYPQHMDNYHHLYPSSVVSSICAVKIEDLSQLKKEKEVLLRGPFFERLHFTRGKHHLADIAHPIDELEVLMMNTNRDHLATYQLRNEDGPARALFGQTIKTRKLEIMAEYYRQKQQEEKAADYQKALPEEKAKYEALTGKPWPAVPVEHLVAE